MKFDGYGFIIVGAFLGVGAGLLFVKAYLMPSYPLETAATYVGANPFQVRNAITTRHETIAGTVWLVAGLTVTLIGTVRAARQQKTGYLIGSWFDIVVLLAAALVVWRLTIAITDRTSRTEYLPVLPGMMREAYWRHGFVLTHSGQHPEDATQGQQPAAHVARERIESARDSLDRIGKTVIADPVVRDRHATPRHCSRRPYIAWATAALR